MVVRGKKRNGFPLNACGNDKDGIAALRNARNDSPSHKASAGKARGNNDRGASDRRDACPTT